MAAHGRRGLALVRISLLTAADGEAPVLPEKQCAGARRIGESVPRDEVRDAELGEQRVLEKLGAPRLVEKPREYAVHFDLRAPDDARSAAGCGMDQCINQIVAARLAIDATPARRRGGALL